MKKIDLKKYVGEIRKTIDVRDQTIYYWTTGQRRPKYEHLITLSKVTGESIDDLVRWFVKYEKKDTRH